MCDVSIKDRLRVAVAFSVLSLKISQETAEDALERLRTEISDQVKEPRCSASTIQVQRNAESSREAEAAAHKLRRILQSQSFCALVSGDEAFSTVHGTDRGRTLASLLLIPAQTLHLVDHSPYGVDMPTYIRSPLEAANLTIAFSSFLTTTPHLLTIAGDVVDRVACDIFDIALRLLSVYLNLDPQFDCEASAETLSSQFSPNPPPTSDVIASLANSAADILLLRFPKHRRIPFAYACTYVVQKHVAALRSLKVLPTSDLHRDAWTKVLQDITMVYVCCLCELAKLLPLPVDHSVSKEDTWNSDCDVLGISLAQCVSDLRALTACSASRSSMAVLWLEESLAESCCIRPWWAQALLG